MTSHFDSCSPSYRAGRPKYPDALFTHLKRICPEHELVWDVACGSGQASVALAEHFNHIYATDISENQILYAMDEP